MPHVQVQIPLVLKFLLFFLTSCTLVFIVISSNMRLIQFNAYFNHHLHIFMLSYITYIIRVHAHTVRTGTAVPTLGTQILSYEFM